MSALEDVKPDIWAEESQGWQAGAWGDGVGGGARWLAGTGVVTRPSGAARSPSDSSSGYVPGAEHHQVSLHTRTTAQLATGGPGANTCSRT